MMRMGIPVRGPIWTFRCGSTHYFAVCGPVHGAAAPSAYEEVDDLNSLQARLRGRGTGGEGLRASVGEIRRALDSLEVKR